jgi:hypothetical protein
MNKALHHDKQIEQSNRVEADQLRDGLAGVIMRNRWLAAEIAQRWAETHGYYLVPKLHSTADLDRQVSR